jgi:hypothetical protein
MKISDFPGFIGWPCLFLFLLPGCKEQDNEIAQRKENISRTEEAKDAAVAEMKELDHQLAVLKQAVKEQQSLRDEMEAKSLKSAGSEKLAVQFRSELEASLNRYAESVSAYRKKYQIP